MFRNEAFCELLHEGCNRSSTEGLLGDVKDGNVWKTFCDPLDATKTFFSDTNNIGLLLNIDWFKPFARSEYKVSAIMMSVLNLPREERFKPKWTIILGIIPGPTEPKVNINTFLKPLVDDLILLWGGIPIGPTGNTIRAALIGVSADMPALRKVSQFLGHKADLGCSRCTFKAERDPTVSGASGKMSYYTPAAAPLRTMAQILGQAQEY